MRAFVDRPALFEMDSCPANKAVNLVSSDPYLLIRSTCRRSRLGSDKALPLLAPFHRIARLRRRQRFLWRRFADGELGPIAALRSGNVEQGADPGEVAARYAVSFGDFGHRLGPNEPV
jgi:hypothetical protein